MGTFCHKSYTFQYYFDFMTNLQSSILLKAEHQNTRNNRKYMYWILKAVDKFVHKWDISQ